MPEEDRLGLVYFNTKKMDPIKFPQHNVVYAEKQEEYRPLPAFRNETETISCWKLTFKERIQLLFGKPLWLRQMNFGQPQLPTTENPFPRRPNYDFAFNLDYTLNVGNLMKYDIIRVPEANLIILEKKWMQESNTLLFSCNLEKELTRWQKFWFKMKRKNLIYNYE